MLGGRAFLGFVVRPGAVVRGVGAPLEDAGPEVGGRLGGVCSLEVREDEGDDDHRQEGVGERGGVETVS